jgi:alkanesulfonate monooxygenase SsuD/methylene tetrahydromethanopterin reductase-like flavin-dependent oxidoreductase (luciferase family)
MVRPAVDEGAARVGREPRQISISASVFVVTDEAESDFVRSQIAFYGSTPSYRPVLELHGWGEVADRLGALARRAAWPEMSELIDDEMLRTFAVVAEPGAVGGALLDRYRQSLDRVTLYLPYYPGSRDSFWATLVRDLAQG